jgi:hypothetical protein
LGKVYIGQYYRSHTVVRLAATETSSDLWSIFLLCLFLIFPSFQTFTLLGRQEASVLITYTWRKQAQGQIVYLWQSQ